MKLKSSRYVHLLHADDAPVAFNSLTLDAFALTEQEASLLEQLREERDYPGELPGPVAEMKRSGLIVAAEDDGAGQATAALNALRTEQYRVGGGAFKTLRLAVTERCNMACSYCFQQQMYPDDQPRMSMETMHATLDWFLGQARGGPVSVQYFGGEPLMEWELIKAAHERLEQARRSGQVRAYRENMTTNGTLITPQRARWMAERGFEITVSFDGPPELNDAQRTFKNGRGTYDRAAAGLRTWIEAGGESAILMTATAENLADLPRIVRWFAEESGLEPKVIGLNSPQPVTGGWETGGAELAGVVFDIWNYCENRGVTFHGPGTYIPLNLREGRSHTDNCVDVESFSHQGEGGAWPVYVSADGRRSRCLVHHRDLRVEMPRAADTHAMGLEWHRGTEAIPDCDSCIASQLCGGPCTLERILWKGRLNQDRCGFMREMTRLVLVESPA